MSLKTFEAEIESFKEAKIKPVIGDIGCVVFDGQTQGSLVSDT
jgi:hypothetical protein